MSTAQERLFGGYYNSAGFTGANPGGLANGGHVQNFPAALQDIGAVAQTVGVQSAAATGAATTAVAARDQAVAAAAQAAQYDPSSKVSKAGDTMTGMLRLGLVANYKVEFRAGGSSAQGGIDFVEPGGAYEARIYTAAGSQYFEAPVGRPWRFTSPVILPTGIPFTSGNDGSGSGLDADYLRGREMATGTIANTIMLRGSDGSSELKTLYLATGGGINFSAINGTMNVRDANNIGLDKGLYLTGTLSAAVVTERSDRRLKREISDIGPVHRLRPRRFIMNDTGEGRLGFVAQEVAEVCPMAVFVGSGGPETAEPMLEVSPMALIAHLAQQLNDALDRIYTLETAR